MISRTVVAATLLAGAGLASADVIASYSFSDLNGSYDAGSQLFSAVADNNADFRTGGDVSSLIGSKGTAQYDTGFLGLGSADVSFQLEVSNITATSADSIGVLSITDADGDTLTASISGSWTILNPFGFMFFTGSSSDYAFTDNGVQDGFFNGSSGAFELAGLANRLLDGAVSLLLQSPGGFATSFADASTQSDGIVIPAPGVLALAGLGVAGMAFGRRRD